MGDFDDLRAIAETFTELRRCPGGRIVNRNGWVCVHCHADLSIGGKCMAPKPGFKRKAREAAKAEAR